jgi:hypothetical protein
MLFSSGSGRPFGGFKRFKAPVESLGGAEDRLKKPSMNVHVCSPFRAASITAMRGRAPVTVAASDELIRATDDVQHAENAGPCVEALPTGTPVGVPDTGAMIRCDRIPGAAPAPS